MEKQSDNLDNINQMEFLNANYEDLYEGFAESDIHASKNLKPGEIMLDLMGSEELGAIILWATQTDAKLRREEIKGKGKANQTHHQVGQEVRETIKRLGGTMPEDLPTPEKSIQQLRQEVQERPEQDQLSLFDAPSEE